MLTRKEFLQTLGAVAVSATAISRLSPAAQPASHKISRGVTFYSYQTAYYTGQMSLEDCIAEAASIGAYGLEVIADAMIPNYPDPPESWVEQWHAWMKRYHTIPVQYCQSQDTTLRPNRPLTTAEGAERLSRDIRCANRMGFTNMRLLGATPLDVVERCLPAAEKYNVSLNFEIHSTNPINGPLVEIWMRLFEKTKSKHIGINPDFSLFENRPNRVMRDQLIRNGMLRADIARYIDQACAERVPRQKAADEVARLGGNSYAEQYLTRRYGTGQDPRLLLPLKQYCHNMHGKIYEMTEDYHETALPYEEVIPFLVQNGFEFCITTEYEGQRFIMDAEQEDEVEQVRRHQVLMKRLLGA